MSGTFPSRYFRLIVYIKIGFLENLPRSRQPTPEPKFFIVIDETFKDHGLDLAAAAELADKDRV
jgi:hypothetical protein